MRMPNDIDGKLAPRLRAELERPWWTDRQASYTHCA
jgi:hypothetical protein